jgi:hypothetical protein
MGREAQGSPMMFLAEWYHFKADQCGLLAKAATDSRKCADHKEIQKFWRELASQAELDEERLEYRIWGRGIYLSGQPRRLADALIEKSYGGAGTCYGAASRIRQ